MEVVSYIHTEALADGALKQALQKGLDPDKPRNLAKCVTVL